MVPRTPIVTNTISPTMAAQMPTADGHVDEWKLGHTPMADPIPSGMATRRISKTSRTIRRVLVTSTSLARSEKVGIRTSGEGRPVT